MIKSTKIPGAVVMIGLILAIAAGFVFAIFYQGGGDRRGSPEPSRDWEPTGLPTIVIETGSGKGPNYREVVAPKGMLGQSVADNEYEKGYCRITNVASAPEYASKVKIKVRGNTSTMVGSEGKLPYKIVLNQPADLFGSGQKNARYVLLASAGIDLKTYLGFSIGRLCGMEWTPRCRYVDLVLNGDWRGTYLLVEALDGATRCDHVPGDGFLIECDAYWWNTDVYFRTDYIAEQMAYTVKHPKIRDESDARLQAIRQYMENFEESLFSEAQLESIDVDSFVAWILARDLLGNNDGAGSNIYYYLAPDDPETKTDYRLKMGPLWDFDYAFYLEDSWSAMHDATTTYFLPLLQDRTFFRAYAERFRSVSSTLLASLREELAALDGSWGEAIDASRRRDALRWGGEYVSLAEETAQRLAWLESRVQWMEAQVSDQEGWADAHLTAEVTGDCSKLELAMKDDGYEQAAFAVWSAEDGQDDLAWYNAQRDWQGNWRYTVDLAQHHSRGAYVIHAYSSGEKMKKIAEVYTFVQKATEPRMTVAFSEDLHRMTVTLCDEGYQRVQFPIWSEENGQDDLFWYEAAQTEKGIWTCMLDLSNHGFGGSYAIHVYVQEGEELRFLEGTTVTSGSNRKDQNG